MKKEYDLINELGPKNWLDTIAGEAVLLGWLAKDPGLTMMGTLLANELREVSFYSDDYSRVEAMAVDLTKKVEEKKTKQKLIVFIDEIYENEGGEKSFTKWEYDLILADGKYEIKMCLPEYIGKIVWSEKDKQIEKAVRESMMNPSFGELRRENSVKMYGCQKMDISDYYTSDNRLIAHEIDFNHECGWKRGRLSVYYFDDYSQVMDAWMKMRAISNQTK